MGICSSMRRRTFLLLLCLTCLLAKAQLKVDGRYLYDPCGKKLLLRGVNEMFIYSNDRTGATTYPEIAKTGANAVRFLWMIDSTVTATVFEQNIQNCLASGMIPIPGLWNATGKWGRDLERCVAWWLKPEVVAVCKNNPNMILNIANEAGSEQMPDYAAVYTLAIKRLRKAGIKNVIMVDADRWGRSWETLRDKAVAIRDADPQKNVLFSWHPWDVNIDYAIPIKEIVAKNICLAIGEYSYQSVGCACCINYKQIMAETQTQQVGTLAWSWGLVKNADCANGAMDMTTNGTFAGLKPGWATDVVYADSNSIRNTAVKPCFVNRQSSNRNKQITKLKKTATPTKN